jgi:hypothetical protein
METKYRKSEVNAGGRWHSTGFMAGGVAAVDAGKHELTGASVIRPGEARGHGIWIDAEMCAQVVALAAGGKESGLKARFGHPNMCNDALGTFLGRWKNLRLADDVHVLKGVIGDLFLSSTAAESPKGDLRKYIEEMAAKEPQHFGASIVFTRDQEAEAALLLANGGKVATDEYGEYIDLAEWKSPDPSNVKNLPHARCAELHAADLVDDPAATDGMFSGAAGLSLAAQVTEWLDTHPEALKAIADAPEMLGIATRYAKELEPFLARYRANAALAVAIPPPEVEPEDEPAGDCEGTGMTHCPACNGTGNKPAPAAESAPAPAPATPTPESAARQAQVDALTSQLSTAEATIAKLTGEITGKDAALQEAQAEIESYRRKFAALESGAPPVSATPAEATEKTKSAWKRAQK